MNGNLHEPRNIFSSLIDFYNNSGHIRIHNLSAEQSPVRTVTFREIIGGVA